MLKLVLNLEKAPSGKIQVSLEGEELSGPLKLEALACQDETFIKGLVLNGQVITPSIEINLPAGPFHLEYSITSPFKNFVGSHLEHDVNYPFFNPGKEAFISSGVLPLTSELEHELIFENIPENWHVFTNLTDDPTHSCRVSRVKFEQFFLYISSSALHFRDNDNSLIIGHGVSLPLLPQEILKFIQASRAIHQKILGPIIKNESRLILILQSPTNFDELTRYKTFSTGENYTGGIAIYGPDRADIYQSLGHDSYEDFILGGLHHEIGHCYTSAGPASEKSLLYASDDCPREERFLIGEALNSYFNGASRLLIDKRHPFSLKSYLEKFYNRLPTSRRIYELDLFLFDCELRKEVNQSLYSAFKRVLEQKRQGSSAFKSADILWKHFELSDELRNRLMKPNISDYLADLNKAIVEQGWQRQTIPHGMEDTIAFFLKE